MAGYRTEAIRIIVAQVLQPRGLTGLGSDSLDYCGREIRQVLQILADSSTYPVLIHCTQGKDRTGLIVLVLLLLLQVPIDVIEADYLRSEPELLLDRDQRLEDIRDVGLTDDFAGTPADWVQKMYLHLSQTYGGIAPYLHGIGVGSETQHLIRHHLLAEP